MLEILRTSVFGRLFSALSAAYPYSALGAAGRFFGRNYERSATKRMIERFLAVPDRAKESAYGRLLALFGALAERICRPLARAYEKSLLRGLFAWGRRALSHSVLFGWAARMGFRRLAILGLALYLPADYVIREIVGIGFLASGWDEGLFLLLLLYVFWRRGATPALAAGRETALDLYILVFVACGFFLMCAVSPYPAVAFDGLRAVVQYMLWFFILMRLLDKREDFLLFYCGLLALALAVGLHGLYQYAVAVPIPTSWVSETEMGVRTRVFSITGSPNILGAFMVMTAPLAAGLLYRWKRAAAKLAAWGMLGVLCLCLLFTFSKGAWIGAAVAVLIFALLVDKRLIALMGAGVTAALIAIPSIADRITYLFTQDFVDASMRGGRMIRWAMGMDLLRFSNRALGFGLGRFGGAVAMQNQILEKTETFQYFYLDNYYLKTLVEMGWVGLSFFILLLLGLVVSSLRAVGRMRKDADYPMVCGIFAGLMGVLVHCFFENIFEVPYMMAYFWMLAALILFRGGSQARPRPENTRQNGA